MTLNELKQHVTMLGFESEIENTDCFIASAKRALDMIYTDRPVLSYAVIPIHSLKVTMYKPIIKHKGGKQIKIPVKGEGIFFRSGGSGECVVETSNGSSLIPLSAKMQENRAIIYDGEGTVTFRGNYFFTVSDFTVYEDCYDRRESSIPAYSSLKTVTVSEYVKDFKSFADAPSDKNGNPLQFAVLSDGKIRVPNCFEGDIHINYYRTPKNINPLYPDEILDISNEIAHLLPLLTASFMWLDDDAGKSQYYMSLYRDAISGVRRYSNSTVRTKYYTDGWA